MYVEKQCVEKLRGGDTSAFLTLFNGSFDGLYTYVARRLVDRAEVERVVNITFIDALGQTMSTPLDTPYSVWLYGIARKRIWEILSKPGVGVVPLPFLDGGSLDKELFDKANSVMGKLTMEEREVLRLKFFEQVSDGDVAHVLQLSEVDIGTKIYRVLKRVHFLLFGESDGRQEIYFGEVSAFFERVRVHAKIDVPEVLKLTLRADLSSRIDKKEFAIEGEEAQVSEDVPFAPVKERAPVTNLEEVVASEGSDDPAKIFVDAVKEMREEEVYEADRVEDLIELFDRLKGYLIAVPLLLFVVVVGFVGYKMFDRGIYRGYPTACASEVSFKGGFSDGEKRSFNAQVSDGLCGMFEVGGIVARKKDDGTYVEVDLGDGSIEYRFDRKDNLWRVKKYARTFNSDEQSG